MADRPNGPEPDELEATGDARDEARLAVAARHALHDEELIAAYAAGTVEPDEAARARGLVERCSACLQLATDLRAIAVAHRATAALVTAAPRDFRISQGDARRLRGLPPASLLERLRGTVAGIARPVGGSLVAAGLVGILVGGFGMGGGPAMAPSIPMSSDTDAVAPGASTESNYQQGGSKATEPGTRNLGGGAGEEGPGPAAAAPSFATLLLAGSAAAVVAGLALLLLSRRGPPRTA